MKQQFPQLKTGKSRMLNYKHAALESAQNIKLNQQFGNRDHKRLT
jgi:hypothetical protein